MRKVKHFRVSVDALDDDLKCLISNTVYIDKIILMNELMISKDYQYVDYITKKMTSELVRKLEE